MDVGIIVAVSDNGVIGKDGKLPWNIPEDMRHFKKLTIGHSVIMGRKTYESIGQPLKYRKNIVLSSVPIDGVNIANSLDEAIMIANQEQSLYAYIIGGRMAYKEALRFADFMEITKIHREVEGNVYFPEVNWDNWYEIKRSDIEDFSFVSYRRK